MSEPDGARDSRGPAAAPPGADGLGAPLVKSDEAGGEEQPVPGEPRQDPQHQPKGTVDILAIFIAVMQLIGPLLLIAVGSLVVAMLLFKWFFS